MLIINVKGLNEDFHQHGDLSSNFYVLFVLYRVQLVGTESLLINTCNKVLKNN